ncbi:haloacid dehalogenase type II [Vibrio agarivorans]|uniref:haloacid dehalogenase type II n=1 Tax=Vibrio agarivorans TaxID=153622 RepID=UPI002231BB19|nr:haloacid dehalogenase type II [Vibrio agarivorans]MDN3660414.1 haloacid dehalogenase type II [Vibrio agarivorans]
MQTQTILFDINETVLDLSSLKTEFTTVFGSEEALSLWFARLLHTSNVCIVTGVTSDFASLASSMIDNLATHYKVDVSEEQRSLLLQGFASLQPYPDIKPALTKLRQSGFRTIAFSNSSQSLIERQIEQAGLLEHFDEIVSVESTGSFKPDPKVYHFVAKQLQRSPQQLLLVATHDWDTHGAMSCGFNAAFIERSNAFYHPLYRQPDVRGKDMHEVVNGILSLGLQS